MIHDKDFAKKQVGRLSQLDFFPSGREAVEELMFAVMAFDSQQVVAAWIGDWIARERSCPKPADIRRAAYEANISENTSWLEKKQCPDCSGSGFKMEARMARALPGMPLARYEYAAKCDHSGRPAKGAGSEPQQERKGVA